MHRPEAVRSLWGADFGMKPRDFFLSGAGIDEKGELGRMTIADFYPRKDMKDPYFPSYEAVLDPEEGLISLTGIRSTGKDGELSARLFDEKLGITADEFGMPLIVKKRNPERDSSVALWKAGDMTLMLTERTDRKGDNFLELHMASCDFHELWSRRNG